MKRTTLIAALLGATIVAGAGFAYAHDRGGDGRGSDGRGGGFGPGRGVEMLFERFDTNGDGSVTRAEIEAEAKARFDEADANGDGELSAEEMAARAEAQRMQRMTDRSARMIERLDTDNNGTVSFEEAQAAPRAGLFDRLDADNDGTVTQAEADAFEGQMRRGGHGQRGRHRN